MSHVAAAGGCEAGGRCQAVQRRGEGCAGGAYRVAHHCLGRLHEERHVVFSPGTGWALRELEGGVHADCSGGGGPFDVSAALRESVLVEHMQPEWALLQPCGNQYALSAGVAQPDGQVIRRNEDTLWQRDCAAICQCEAAAAPDRVPSART